MLHHITTRWLSLNLAITWVFQSWTALKSYFINLWMNIPGRSELYSSFLSMQTRELKSTVSILRLFFDFLGLEVWKFYPFISRCIPHLCSIFIKIGPLEHFQKNTNLKNEKNEKKKWLFSPFMKKLSKTEKRLCIMYLHWPFTNT